MSERLLASIQQIASLSPIEGADKIEVAQVLGWQCVVKKGEFQQGDRCVFVEEGSVVPVDRPVFAFMAKTGGRVKTVKLRGVVSQGLALPVTDTFPAGDWQDGQDVSALLGVTRFIPKDNAGRPCPSKGATTAGDFPSDIIPKTDEIRLQSKPQLLDELHAAGPWYATVKYDGSSATFIRRADIGDPLWICSRTRRIKADPGNPDAAARNPWLSVAARYDLVNRLPIGIAIQGEVVGPGIRKNPLGLTEVDLRVFNVYDVFERKFLDWPEACRIGMAAGLTMVETVAGPMTDPLTVETAVQLSRGLYTGTKNHREGVVIRPVSYTRSAILHDRLSFKVINPDFLLGGDDDIGGIEE